MRSKLYRDDILITDKIAEVLIDPDAIKIRRRLLDGTYHVQSIGSTARNIRLDCYVTEAGKTIIDQAFEEDAHLKLIKDGKYYIGLLIDDPKWNITIKGSPANRLYTVKLVINIQSEGVV